MTEEPNSNKPEIRTLETEWVQAFNQIPQLGVTVAQWMNQLGIGTDADLQRVTLTEPINDTPKAALRLDMAIGRARIKALPPGSPNLIEADVVSIGGVELNSKTENGVKSLRLLQKRSIDDLLNTEELPTPDELLKPMKDAVDTVARIDELLWDVRLSPDVPLTLEVSAGLTLDAFDFTGLQLTRLKMDSGIGHTVVTFPATVITAVVEGSVGVLDIHIPDEARTTLNLNAGAGTTSLFIGDAAVKAEIDGGVGSCNIKVPADAALRVTADSGLGNISVPENATPVAIESEFISESGIWQTPRYEVATRKIDIRYDGIVGSLIVEH